MYINIFTLLEKWINIYIIYIIIYIIYTYII